MVEARAVKLRIAHPRSPLSLDSDGELDAIVSLALRPRV
jgi:hypothetical protein